MEDQSFFNSNPPKDGISENLQHYIDSMLEEIVLEGKPFDTQKKYLKKFSESEGLDYEKMESEIASLIGILEGIRKAPDNESLRNLAAEKGTECYVSEETLHKLLSNPSRWKMGKKNRRWLWVVVIAAMAVLAVLALWLPKYYNTKQSVALYQQGMKEYEAENYSEAVVSFMESVKKGNEEAKEMLCQCCYRDEGIEKLDSKWLKTKAESGESWAQYVCGVCYLNGIGVEKRLDSTRIWFEKSAESGNRWGQLNLGNCYYSGQVFDKDYDEAYQWCQKAKEQGLAEAQVFLDAIDNIKQADDLYQQGMKDYEQRNYSEAAASFMESAKKGNKDTHEFLCWCCYYYYNDPIDFQWIKAKAEEGEAWAQNLYGEGCYIRYLNAFKDKTHAADSVYIDSAYNWYKKSAEQGNRWGQLNYGNCYYRGERVAQDYVKAREWYLKAANQGLAEAQFEMGELYKFEKGVERDNKKAFEWYKKAADQSLAAAQERVGYMYEWGYGVDEDDKIAADWYRRSAEQGWAEGQYELGGMYEHGWGVEKNLYEAVYWYGKAADQGHSLAQNRVDEINATIPIYVNGVTFDMKYVEGGTFKMGSNGSEAWSDEKPVHDVTVNSFYMGELEVTQGLWKAVMKTELKEWKAEYGKGDDYPAYAVSWDECQTFIKKLNELTGKNFRLPTEAEWEYAARGGKKNQNYKYAGSNVVGEVAHYKENSNKTCNWKRVFGRNELYLYNMSGNVHEWCSDWYGKDYYKNSPSKNPKGPSSGEERVLRGGSYYSDARKCRVSYRNNNYPDKKDSGYGFRLVLPK